MRKYTHNITTFSFDEGRILARFTLDATGMGFLYFKDEQGDFSWTFEPGQVPTDVDEIRYLIGKAYSIREMATKRVPD